MLKITKATYGNFESLSQDIFPQLKEFTSTAPGGMWSAPARDGDRAYLFGDPCVGVLKQIVLTLQHPDGSEKLLALQDGDYAQLSATPTGIALHSYDLRADKIARWRLDILPASTTTSQKLAALHPLLALNSGSLAEEFVEQTLSVKYVDPRYKVLEIGGNIGRNSCIISSILEDSSHLTVIECDPVSAKVLKNNRDANNFRFAVKQGALSKARMYQKGWQTWVLPSGGKIPSDCTEVSTFGIEEIGASFDALIADCEGSFSNILRDFPALLDQPKLVIVENDFADLADYVYMRERLQRAGFALEYSQGGGWGPCASFFNEVFTRR